MSLNDFLNIAKNIKTNGKEIDSELLIAFYHDIKDSPIALHFSEKKKQELQNIINASNKTKGMLFLNEIT